MLKLDRRTSTNQLHRDLSLLEVFDIHDVNVMRFIINCEAARYPETFCTDYKAQQIERDLRSNDHFMYHGLGLRRVLAHVTWKELESGTNNLRL